MTFEDLRGMLAQVGIPQELLDEADESWKIRHDLALNSAETIALQAKLKAHFKAEVSLWGEQDYSLGEIISYRK